MPFIPFSAGGNTGNIKVSHILPGEIDGELYSLVITTANRWSAFDAMYEMIVISKQ